DQDPEAYHGERIPPEGEPADVRLTEARLAPGRRRLRQEPAAERHEPAGRRHRARGSTTRYRRSESRLRPMTMVPTTIVPPRTAFMSALRSELVMYCPSPGQAKTVSVSTEPSRRFA